MPLPGPRFNTSPSEWLTNRGKDVSILPSIRASIPASAVIPVESSPFPAHVLWFATICLKWCCSHVASEQAFSKFPVFYTYVLFVLLQSVLRFTVYHWYPQRIGRDIGILNSSASSWGAESSSRSTEGDSPHSRERRAWPETCSHWFLCSRLEKHWSARCAAALVAIANNRGTGTQPSGRPGFAILGLVILHLHIPSHLVETYEELFWGRLVFRRISPIWRCWPIPEARFSACGLIRNRRFTYLYFAFGPCHYGRLRRSRAWRHARKLRRAMRKLNGRRAIA